MRHDSVAVAAAAAAAAGGGGGGGGGGGENVKEDEGTNRHPKCTESGMMMMMVRVMITMIGRRHVLRSAIYGTLLDVCVKESVAINVCGGGTRYIINHHSSLVTLYSVHRRVSCVVWCQGAGPADRGPNFSNFCDSRACRKS